MSNITILSETLANKIAAGEVIERPASVVRELLDNSIDAGAKTISVEILHGGKKLIKVVDDGTGMDRDDALLCFERHATSKIKKEEDLFDIRTLGFRGEALSSIASISKVLLVTSSQGASTGTKIEIDSSGKKKITDAPPLSGTTLEVRDIFYNLPGRRKFLKSNTTEASHIIDIVMQKALSYPEISFKLRHNNVEVIDVSSVSNIGERFAQLYSRDLLNEFIEVRQKVRDLNLYGFVSVPAFTRSTRNYQMIFINRRPVKNPTVSHAIYSAYKDLIPKDRHPAFFLFMDIDTRKVDVNVHPAKREVKFEAPEEVHREVAIAIKEALNANRRDINLNKTPITSGYHEHKTIGFSDISLVRETLESVFEPEAIETSESKADQIDIFTRDITPSVNRFFYIGECFYATPVKDGIMIIDQHAAHERILYEKLLKKTNINVEQLVLPLRIELSAKEFNMVMNYRDVFQDMGLHFDDFGGNSIIIRALPVELKKADIKGLIMDVVSEILDLQTDGIKNESTKQTLIKNIASAIACHRSVRGSEQLTDKELSKLVSDLERCDNPDKCPHGRPTRVILSLDDLKKMFRKK
jgi:DNA mismatch repair protein MutL